LIFPFPVPPPILADAMEEAGCTDAAILDHCRGPGPHARGCWLLDLILEKEAPVGLVPRRDEVTTRLPFLT
jgi:hypothetical protein